MRRVRSAIVGLALLVPFIACRSGEEEGAPSPDTPATEQPLPPGVTMQMVEQGEQIFGTVCVACHGQGGVGTQLAPALNDAQWINIGGEYDQIVSVIRTGVLQPRQFPSPMPPMDVDDFTDDQIRAIAAYVYSISHHG
jgi:mono/diheme cytochrome c family protein